MACRKSKKTQLAFVLLNHFVDLCDAIEDPDDPVDNSDFTNTDIPSPFSMNIPTDHFYSEKKREDVREWVLETAVSSNDYQVLPLRKCTQCGETTYEGNLLCHNCQLESLPCIITGYPIFDQTANTVECRSCHKKANKASWNVYIDQFKSCPWCKQPQAPIY